MKTRLVEDELFHADRRTNLRTDMTKLISRFFNYANAPNALGSSWNLTPTIFECSI
jgi:hypothetical protein